ncbi:hypothetical protein DYB32_002701 [Aphanomyces invadans]|uniref:Protein kinase domain-containing protein n=1 Tax=Aphanomyces invadans TaxID=157072 RepID=A0A418B2J8_9STRA|nr:hypothetical protein DYB32_002701 [Aphanomyces invadans]
MLVLYDVLGEVASSERHPNAFRVSDSVHPIRLKDVQDACPFEHCHFSFQHENGVFGSYTNPNSVVPIVNRSRIRAKIVVSAGPVAEKGVYHDDVIHVMAASAGTPSCCTQNSHLLHRDSAIIVAHQLIQLTIVFSTQIDKGVWARSWHCSSGGLMSGSSCSQDHAAPWEATFGDNPSRDSSGGSNTSRGAEGSSALGGISTAEIKEKLKKQTEIAKDFAKNLHVDDMKRNAVEFAKTMNLDETARKAKKWGGSLLSSISNSISSASNAMSKGEVLSLGNTQVNIVRLLAEGGYGQVFLVKTVGSNETCALKRVVITSAEVESDAAIERQVYQALFLLPFYDHGTLWDAILRAANDTDQPWPFDERRILNIFQGIASGVAALHAAGFAHRDLKPHNVLFDHRDHSILMDFGSCAPLVTEIADRRTVSMLLHGVHDLVTWMQLMLVQENANRKCSAPYRAPELFEPEVGHIVNGQSDVWSLGCLLYVRYQLVVTW